MVPSLESLRCATGTLVFYHREVVRDKEPPAVHAETFVVRQGQVSPGSQFMYVFVSKRVRIGGYGRSG